MANNEDAAHAVLNVAPIVIVLLQRVLPNRGVPSSNATRAQVSPQAERSSEPQDDNAFALEARETAGTDLWDITQSEHPATIAVQNSALKILPEVVLHAISHQQPRLAELLLGSLANILCHPTLAELAANQETLLQAVLDIAHSTTDAPCLAEAFRLMAVAVNGPGSNAWLNILLQGPFNLLQHVVWVADNTLNAVLFERCLQLTLEIAYKREQTLQQTLEAGMMPVIIHALGNYTHMLRQNAAVQTDAEGSPSDSPQSSAGAPVPGPVPTHSAVLAALSICEVLTQDPDNPFFAAHLSTLSDLWVQMLKLHELLHHKASVQRLLVVLLACINSSLWLPSLVTSVAALEAALEVLQNDYGFEEEAEEAEAVQGQEAAWAVLAAVSRHLTSHECQIQVLHCLADHTDTLTNKSLAAVAPDSTSYTWSSLLQLLDRKASTHAQPKAEAEELQKLVTFRRRLKEALGHIQAAEAEEL